jgi:hypothetical protein
MRDLNLKPEKVVQFHPGHVGLLRLRFRNEYVRFDIQIASLTHSEVPVSLTCRNAGKSAIDYPVRIVLAQWIT